MIFAKQFDQITKADIDELVSNQVPEGQELDYKELLPGTTLDEKREYLYDLTSFANTSGGVMIFGIAEQRDANNNPTGVPASASGLTGINADKQIQRLESFQLTGIQRRVPNVRIREIGGFTNGPIILVYVPKSWAAPHLVTLGGIHRFYARNERGKYLLDWHQIQSAFLLSESLAERIRNFRYDRLARIVAAEDLPSTLEGEARAVLHIVPASALAQGAAVDFLKFRNNPGSLPPPNYLSSSGWNGRVNFDGFAQTLQQVSYVQLFRTGAIEAVDAWLLNCRRGVLPFPAFEQEIANLTRIYMNVIQSLRAAPPIFLMLSLLRVRDYTIVNETMGLPASGKIDRTNLLLPDVMVEKFPCDVHELLRPVFDAAWQSAGRDRSASYDAQGKWLLK
ncbi:MAG: ATP-binding protein [Candidatus Binatus sp.]|jgi:hypothetical protein